GLSCQLSFWKSNAPLPSRSSRIGSASTSLMPELTSDGPMPRTATSLGALPVMMNPPIITLSPISTRIRVEILSAWDGEGVGVSVGVGVGVDVGVEVAIGVAVAVGVGVDVGVNGSTKIPRPNVAAYNEPDAARYSR